MEARKFATLAGALTAAVPRHDAFHRAFTRLTPATVRAINDAVVQAAVAAALEEGTTLRVDLPAAEVVLAHRPAWPSRCATLGVMARVNLTLDEETSRELDRHTKRTGKPRATVVRELLREGLARRAAAERRKRLAADYAAGRSDARAVLGDFEAAQLELMDDEEA